MIPIGPAIAVALALRPVVVRLARAARQDSPGGKRITREEVGEILLGATPAVVRAVGAVDGGLGSVRVPVIPVDPVAEATVEAYIREHGRRACPACDGRPATSCPVCGVVGG